MPLSNCRPCIWTKPSVCLNILTTSVAQFGRVVASQSFFEHVGELCVFRDASQSDLLAFAFVSLVQYFSSIAHHAPGQVMMLVVQNQSSAEGNSDSNSCLNVSASSAVPEDLPERQAPRRRWIAGPEDLPEYGEEDAGSCGSEVGTSRRLLSLSRVECEK